MIDEALKEGWLERSDVDLANRLVEDFDNKGFETTINNYKSEIISSNYSQEEFDKQNTFVNIMEVMHEDQPALFENSKLQAKGFWSCLWAIIVFILAYASVLACVTWVLCGFALYGLALATNDLVDECN
jgi:hypothetical protein